MQTRQIQTAIIVSVLLSAASLLAEWRIFTTDDGLAVNSVTEILEDASGNMWFTNHRNWTTYTREDGLAPKPVDIIFQDSSGDMWFASSDNDYSGVSRFDGSTWTTYPTACRTKT